VSSPPRGLLCTAPSMTEIKIAAPKRSQEIAMDSAEPEAGRVIGVGENPRHDPAPVCGLVHKTTARGACALAAVSPTNLARDRSARAVNQPRGGGGRDAGGHARQGRGIAVSACVMKRLWATVTAPPAYPRGRAAGVAMGQKDVSATLSRRGARFVGRCQMLPRGTLGAHRGPLRTSAPCGGRRAQAPFQGEHPRPVFARLCARSRACRWCRRLAATQDLGGESAAGPTVLAIRPPGGSIFPNEGKRTRCA